MISISWEYSGNLTPQPALWENWGASLASSSWTCFFFWKHKFLTWANGGGLDVIKLIELIWTLHNGLVEYSKCDVLGHSKCSRV